MAQIEDLKFQVKVLQAEVATPRGKPRWVSVTPVDVAMARRMNGPAPIPLTFTIPPGRVDCDELNEAMNAGLGWLRGRCLTRKEVELLTAALSDADPRVKENARLSLEAAQEGGRMPEDTK